MKDVCPSDVNLHRKSDTPARIGTHTQIRVLPDTTSLRYSGDREGLGIIARGQKGFRAHVALAVTADELREPLGVLGVSPFIHQHTLTNREMTDSEITIHTRNKPRHEKESSRWEKLAKEVSAILPSATSAIHVIDQEADDFTLFADLQSAGLRFVVRVWPERMTASRCGKSGAPEWRGGFAHSGGFARGAGPSLRAVPWCAKRATGSPSRSRRSKHSRPNVRARASRRPRVGAFPSR